MLVKDLYLDSLLYEESSLAHCIYHLLTENKITLEEDISGLDLNLCDSKKVAKMIKENVLGFNPIHLYSLKMEPGEFVFIFARCEKEAVQFFVEKFQLKPKNCHLFPLDFEMARENRVLTFREMKKEFVEFPAVAGVYSRF